MDTVADAPEENGSSLITRLPLGRDGVWKTAEWEGKLRVKDEAAHVLVEALAEASVNLVAYLPDDLLSGGQRLLSQDPRFKTVAVASESEGVGVCCGAWMGGRKPALAISDSGFLVATYPLATLSVGYGIPLLLLIAHRGEVGDRNNWRFLTYKFTTEPMLDALHVPYTRARDISEIREAVTGAQLSTTVYQNPVAVLLSGRAIAN